MAYTRTIPQAPLPISQLPPVETLTDDDLLLVTQLGDTTGHRSRKMTAGALASSLPMRNAGGLGHITSSAPSSGAWNVDTSSMVGKSQILVQLNRAVNYNVTDVTISIPSSFTGEMDVMVYWGSSAVDLRVAFGTYPSIYLQASLGQCIKATFVGGVLQTYNVTQKDPAKFDTLDAAQVNMGAFKLGTTGMTIITTTGDYTASDVHHDTENDWKNDPVRIFLNWRDDKKFTFAGADTNTSAYTQANVMIQHCTAVMLIPCKSIKIVDGSQYNNKYRTLYACLGGVPLSY